jgi:uncharacterized protein YqhQ
LIYLKGVDVNSTIKTKLTFAVTLMVSFTLCLVVIGMVGVLMAGLFDPLVDNAEIFKLISPAFQTIVGGFIGLLAGVKLSHDEDAAPPCKKD